MVGFVEFKKGAFTMKKVYYKKSMLQMGDLLNEYDIDIKKDFSKRKRERI